VEDAGTGFAFPTRTVHLINEPSTAPKAPGGPGAPRPRPSEGPGQSGQIRNLPTTDE